MRRGDWSLIIFTLLVQMAIGTFLVLAGLTFLDRLHLPQDLIGTLNLTIVLIVPPLLVLGVLSAILHLKRPGNAKHAMANLKKSWLSREMLLGISFGFVSLLLCAVQLLEIDPPIIFTILLGAGALLGALFLYGMSRIYMLRTVPAWNIWATPVSFFITALLLGGLILSIAVSLLFQAYSSTEVILNSAEELLRLTGWGSAFLLSTQLFVSFVKDRYLLWRGGDSQESLRLVKERHPALGLLREALGLLAIGLCILFALQPFSNTEFLFDVAIVLAFLLALTSETIGRFLFYASFRRSGL